MKSAILRKSAFFALCVGTAALANPGSARATLTLTLNEVSGPTTTITDNGAGDLDPTVGNIIVGGTFGDFRVESNIASSNAALGVSPAQITINNLSITSLTNSGPVTLNVTVEDNGFTAPGAGPAIVTSQLSTTQLPSNVVVTYASFVNGVQAGPTLSLNTVAGTTGSGGTTLTSPYTLRSVSGFTVTGSNQTVQYTGITTVAVPEPATVAMALTALPLLGLGYLRRRRAHA